MSLEAPANEQLGWIILSAKQGYKKAHQDLGSRYAQGYGVAQDNIQAYMWFTLSQNNTGTPEPDVGGMRFVHIGDNNQADLTQLEKKMTPEQIAEAKKLAAEWKPVKTPE